MLPVPCSCSPEQSQGLVTWGQSPSRLEAAPSLYMSCFWPQERKCGPEPGTAAKAGQTVNAFGAILHGRKQALVNKPSSSFPTPHSNDSEGCSRVCLSEEPQQDRARTAHSTTCPSVHAFPSCLFSSKLITPALCPRTPPISFPNYLYHGHRVQVCSGGSPN